MTAALGQTGFLAAPDAKGALVAALLEIERGIYAIQSMTEADTSDAVVAAIAFGGIEYVATKLNRDVRAILNPLVDRVAAAQAIGGAA